MTKVSKAQKAGIAARILARQVQGSRAYGAVLKGGRAAAAHTGRVMNQLWLEVTGFTFLALAGIGLIAFVREVLKYQANRADSSRMVIAICFTVMFGWFGLSSFWRVRKANRSNFRHRRER
jgi:hypothetical protein